MVESDTVPSCLVTGGAGFIGSALVEALVTAGYRVRVLDNLSTGRLDNMAPMTGVEFFEGDVRNHDLVSQATAGMDFIVHLAGIAAGGE